MLDAVEPHIFSLRIASDAESHLGPATLDSLRAAVVEATADDRVRVILVEGGARHFCSGASRASLLATGAGNAIANYALEVPRLVLSLPVPTVAVMQGHAIGGGLALGLWCDVAVLAEESLYGANFMALGFTPGMGSTVVVEDTFGAVAARDLLLSGRLVKGRELATSGAAALGLVRPRAEVRDEALRVSRRWAANDRRALMLLKRTLAGRRRERFERAATEEALMHATLFEDPQTRARIAAEHAQTAVDRDGQ